MSLYNQFNFNNKFRCFRDSIIFYTVLLKGLEHSNNNSPAVACRLKTRWTGYTS